MNLKGYIRKKVDETQQYIVDQLEQAEQEAEACRHGFWENVDEFGFSKAWKIEKKKKEIRKSFRDIADEISSRFISND